jgi:SGNH domain (fused to AT3 domains)
VGTFVFLPADLRASTAHEVTASAFYVQNLWLAGKAVTYSASNDVASPVTHYWSLSAEAQFYLVWPAPYVLRDNLGTPQLLALMLVCLVVSGLSKKYVEDATRFWPRLSTSPRATLMAAGIGMLVIALVAGTQVFAGGCPATYARSVMFERRSRDGTPQCLAVNAGKPQDCSNLRSTVPVDDDRMRAARSMSGAVNLVDLSDYFCDARRCYAAIGGASVYDDYDHISMQFSGTLAAALLRGLPKP